MNASPQFMITRILDLSQELLFRIKKSQTFLSYFTFRQFPFFRCDIYVLQSLDLLIFLYIFYIDKYFTLLYIYAVAVNLEFILERFVKNSQ